MFSLYGRVEVAPLGTLVINSDKCPAGFEEVKPEKKEIVTEEVKTTNVITEEVKYVPETVVTEVKGLMKSGGIFGADDSNVTIGVKNKTGRGRK